MDTDKISKHFQEELIRTVNRLARIKNLNSMLGLPEKYMKLVKGSRCPIHEHFGNALFPIPADFDTGYEDITIKRLANALIDPDCVEIGLQKFYKFMPGGINRIDFDDVRLIDESLIKETLIRFMFYDYACLHNFGMPYKRLMVEVGKKGIDAFLKMVQVDKTFLLGAYGQSLIIRKQQEADWDFFEEVGEAVRKKPVDETRYMFTTKILCAYFWDREFERMSYRDIVGVLEELGLIAKCVVDPRSLSKALNRQGLKKSKHVVNRDI